MPPAKPCSGQHRQRTRTAPAHDWEPNQTTVAITQTPQLRIKQQGPQARTGNARLSLSRETRTRQAQPPTDRHGDSAEWTRLRAARDTLCSSRSSTGPLGTHTEVSPRNLIHGTPVTKADFPRKQETERPVCRLHNRHQCGRWLLPMPTSEGSCPAHCHNAALRVFLLCTHNLTPRHTTRAAAHRGTRPGKEL